MQRQWDPSKYYYLLTNFYSNLLIDNFFIDIAFLKLFHFFFVTDDNAPAAYLTSNVVDVPFDESNGRNGAQCTVCYLNRCNTVMVPCGHTCCRRCFLAQMDPAGPMWCGNCRTKFSGYVTFYSST